jgi:hypothetical protein
MCSMLMGRGFRGLSTAKALMQRSSLPQDRLLYQDLQGLADGQLIEWNHHRYLRTIQGHKQVREVEVTAAGELTSWDGTHGRVKQIQTFHCQACHATFSARHNTPLYRLKTPSQQVARVLSALTEGLDHSAAE